MSEVLNLLLSFGIFSLLFSAIFKWIPERPIASSAALKGGLITALLFKVGKTVIGIYLGQAAVGSAYEAAGSVIVLLFWVYYSSLIIFFGAEIASVMPAAQSSTLGHAIHTKPSRAYEFGGALLQKVRRTPNWIFWTLGILFVFRAAMPVIGLRIINHALETKLSEYTGHLRDFDLSLYRGAYQLQGLEITKRNSDLPPILTVAEIDLALAWRSLFEKSSREKFEFNACLCS